MDVSEASRQGGGLTLPSKYYGVLRLAVARLAGVAVGASNSNLQGAEALLGVLLRADEPHLVCANLFVSVSATLPYVARQLIDRESILWQRGETRQKC